MIRTLAHNVISFIFNIVYKIVPGIWEDNYQEPSLFNFQAPSNQQFYYRIILLKERNYLIIITSENVFTRLILDKITF